MSSPERPETPRDTPAAESTATSSPAGAAPAASAPEGAGPWTPMERRAVPARRRRPGPVMIVGLVLFAVGVVFSIAAAVAPFVLGHDGPTYLYLGAMLFTPLGFVLTVVPGLLAARKPR